MAARKPTGSKVGPTEDALAIDREALETFRATLPEYRRYETYTFFTVNWDIVRGLYLIHSKPRDPQMIDVALFARNYGFPFAPGGAADEDIPEDSGFFYVNTKTVMSEQTDLKRAVLIALIASEGHERPGAVLIDGLHRVFKAARSGIPQLPAYVLTPDEERLCRI